MDSATLRLGDAEIDLDRREVRSPRGASTLTPLEARLLGFLADRTGRFVARQELLTEVWGYAEGVTTRAVDNTVSRLRRKIEPEPATPQWITSTRGGGYRLVPAAPHDPGHAGTSELDRVADPRALGAEPVPHNLPEEPDRFVGRVDVLARIALALDSGARLVSIVGVGGVGKTRTALRAAREALGRFTGGCWFCDLTRARDASGIHAAVADALCISVQGADPETQIGHALAALGRGLLVLDNFEQLLAWAPILTRWCALAPELTVLVTSRAVITAPSDAQIELGPMSTTDAADLFMVRASEAYRGTLGDRDIVERLVGMLDGLPLAVELAAVRVRVMGPAAIAARMGERFRLLARTDPDAGRHGTLRATLDASWDLASPAERAVLAQISVFAGPFTAEAAQAVVAIDRDAVRPWIDRDAVRPWIDRDAAHPWIDPIDTAPIAPILTALVDQSLLRRRPGDRLDLLVTVREYAHDRLDPDARAAAEVRHGRWFAALGADANLSGVYGPGGVERQDTLTEALPDLLAASRRAAERGDADVAARTARAAWLGSRRQGLVAPAVAALERALAIADGLPLDARVRLRTDLATGLARLGRRCDDVLSAAIDGARALGDGGLVARALLIAAKHAATFDTMDRAVELCAEARSVAAAAGDRWAEAAASTELGKLLTVRGSGAEARAPLEAGLAAYRQLGDRAGEGAALADLALLEGALGSAEVGWACIEEALAVHQEVGDRVAEAGGLNLAAKIHARLGRTAAAARCYRTALGVFRELGDLQSVAITLRHVGNLAREQGRFAEAREAYEEGRTMARAIGNRRTEATHSSNLAALHCEQGDYELARMLFGEVLATYRDLGMTGSEGIVLGNLGEIELVVGHLDEARALFEAAAAVHRGRDPRNTGTALKRLAQLARLEGRLDDARRLILEALGISQTLGDRRYEAMALHELAEIALAERDLEDAAAQLERAEAFARERDDRLMLALILCTRVEVELAAGRRVLAAASLARVEAHILPEFGPRSEVRVRAAALRARLADPA